MYQLSSEPKDAEDIFKSLLIYNISSHFVFNYHIIFVFNIVLQVLSGTPGKNLDVLLLQNLNTQCCEIRLSLSHQKEQQDYEEHSVA